LKLGKTASETHEILKTAFGDNAMGRTQSFEWFSRFKRGTNIKSMLVILFDCEDIVHQEFVPPGQTVNQSYYLEVLKLLREQVRRKRLELWRNQDWLLHHDNAEAHTATRNSKKSVPVVFPAVAETLDPLHKLGRGIL
jgi:hypothetical protein